MFVEKPLFNHLQLNSEQTKQLFFESLMKYVWQLLNLGERLSHFFENLTSFGHSAISV